MDSFYRKTDLGEIKLKFEINYAIRTNSADFLRNIGSESCKNRCEEYIDFWFIYHAYNTISDWVKKNKRSAFALQDYFKNKVKIIWYEVGEIVKDAISLFSRLNIGKIPLTNAELVKALFLSNAGKDSNIKPQEIAFQWDQIETALHNKSFWCFLTNASDDEYHTRIDLILELISKKSGNRYDKYATFFGFMKNMKVKGI